MSTSRTVALAKQNARAAEEMRHVRKVGKIERNHRNELQKIQEENQRAVKSVKRDYYLQLKGLSDRENVKVKKIQAKIKKAVIDEKSRAKITLGELKSVHENQIKRLRVNQEAQLQQIREEHQIQLDNAIRKFNLEREKFEPATAKEKR